MSTQNKFRIGDKVKKISNTPGHDECGEIGQEARIESLRYVTLSDGNCSQFEDFELIPSNITWETLKKGDYLYGRVGEDSPWVEKEKFKVIELVGSVIFLSDPEDHSAVMGYYTMPELQGFGMKIVQSGDQEPTDKKKKEFGAVNIFIASILVILMLYFFSR